jgi:hypothetical protein
MRAISVRSTHHFRPISPKRTPKRRRFVTRPPVSSSTSRSAAASTVSPVHVGAGERFMND